MKTSILIIAHNEEKNIAKCIESVLNQTQKPDEIILIVHNCTDSTLQIAKKYSEVNTIFYNGQTGIVSARLEGIDHISGDIILCIDGDSFAKKNWVEIMTKILQINNNILVGSWIKFKGTIFGRLANIFNKYLCVSNNDKATGWIWGPSFAFWNKDKNFVKEVLQKSILLSKKLNLSRITDDYWLALFMSKKGNLEVTNKTWVTQHTKETSTIKAILRNIEDHKNGYIMKNYFNKNNI